MRNRSFEKCSGPALSVNRMNDGGCTPACVMYKIFRSSNFSYSTTRFNSPVVTRLNADSFTRLIRFQQIRNARTFESGRMKIIGA